MKFLLQWMDCFGTAHSKQRTAGVNGRFGSMMNVGRCAAKRAARDCGMVHEIVLFIHDRACAADEQQRIAIIQLSHLVRGQQLTPGHLEIGRVGAGFAFRLPVRFRINCGFAKHFGDIFVRTGLVTAKIQNGIAVTWNCLPAILIQFFDLCHILNDNACRDGTRAHRRKLAREARQRHGGELVQHEANVARQRAVMNLVCAVIQGLECLRVKQAYKEIVG